MISFPESLNAWNTPDFKTVLKREIEQLDHDQLPLQQGLSLSSHVLDEPFTARVIAVTDTAEAILVTAGIFYSGIIAGCSCADDPTPIEAQNEYCEVQIAIDKTTAGATFRLVPD
jgi:hypothetical protein